MGTFQQTQEDAMRAFGWHLLRSVRSGLAGNNRAVVIGAVVSMMVKNKLFNAAFEMWREIQSAKIVPTIPTYVSLLEACADSGTSESLEIGRGIHSKLKREELQEVRLSTALMLMYLSCGQSSTALEIWKTYSLANVATEITYISILGVCASLGNQEALIEGENIHQRLSEEVLRNNIKVGTSLLKMYLKCNAPEKAVHVWSKWKYNDKIALSTSLAACAVVGKPALSTVEEIHAQISRLGGANTDIHLWNNLLNAYLQCDQAAKALGILDLIQSRGFEPDSMTYSCALMACAKIGPEALTRGTLIDLAFYSSRIPRSATVFNSTMSMYTSCGLPDVAIRLWDEFSEHTSASFVCLLTACSAINSEETIQRGKAAHLKIAADPNLNCDIRVLSALMSFYTNAGDAEAAFNVWDDLTSRKVEVDAVAYLSCFGACSLLPETEAVAKGESIYRLILQQYGQSVSPQLQNALIQMYIKCGAPGKALEIFKELIHEQWGRQCIISYQ